MQIIDLTENYFRDYIENGNRQAYENSFPELFDHYYQFWTKRELEIVGVKNDDIQIRKSWINQLIEKLTGIFANHEIDFKAIDFVYFIGVGTTNGHAFKYQDRYYIWLPLETYTSEKLVDVFVTHEIAHALHYQHSPLFYFGSKDEQLRMSRQLITEGLATYITRQLLGITAMQALWDDYLSENDTEAWWRKCAAEQRNLLRLIYDNYYKSDRNIEIFYADNPDNIYQFRSGYYAGLKVIENYATKDRLTLKELLGLPRAKFEKDIFALIQSLL